MPENLSITAPASGDIAEPTAFGNSAAGLSKLMYSWDFGDGSAVSAEAAPKHVFAKPGEYEVKLRVSNEAGQAKEVKTTITVNNQAAVRGLECSGASETGWCWQAPRPTGHEPNSITFANATTGWRVGAIGEIFKTTDGGKTWVRQRSGVTVDLLEVVFWDDKIGWIRGDNSSTLLSTRDGGSTWTTMVSPWYNFGLSFHTRFRVEGERTIEYNDGDKYRSEDGGLTWQIIESGSSRYSVGGGVYLAWSSNGLHRYSSLDAEPVEVLQLKDTDGTLFYIHNRDLYALGKTSLIVRGRGDAVWDPLKNRKTYRQALWRSDDRGETWSRLAATWLGAENFWLNIRSLDAAGRVLLADVEGKVFRSEDGGHSWAQGSVSGLSRFGNLIVQGTRAFAESSDGPYYSDDLGKTWNVLSLPLPSSNGASSYSLRMSEAGAGLLFGKPELGSIVSLDKGLTWVRVGEGSYSSNDARHGVAFRDAKNGILLNTKGEMLQSSDGGKSWKLKRSDLRAPSAYYYYAGGVQFVNSKTGFLLNWDERLYKASLYKTSDGGETWAAVLSSILCCRFGFTDENNGWAQSDLSPYGVRVTRDGAGSWTELTRPSFYFGDLRVDVANGLTAVGVAGSIAQSSDDGKTWSMRDSGLNEYLNRVYSRDGKSYWVLGRAGTVLRSDDGGLTWAKVPVPSSANLLDVQFSDAKNGWIVGEQGTILATRDGGKTWTPQASGTSKALRTVQLIDSRTGWIVGDQGTLLATGTGGH